jgi:ABC-2 type transport system ATP-binding protein
MRTSTSIAATSASRHKSHAKFRSLELLAQFLLTERKDVYPTQLSGGLAQRVQIARAIAHRPTVLFLDEPSAGLDPQSRMAMWTAVEGLRKEGITVLLTTHYMEEADSLSDRVAIIDSGRVLALGSPEKLKSTFGAHTIFNIKLKSLEGLQPIVAALKARGDVTSAEATADGLRVIGATADGLLPDLVQATAGHGLRDLAITEPSLETVFIQLTGRDLRE